MTTLTPLGVVMETAAGTYDIFCIIMEKGKGGFLQIQAVKFKIRAKLYLLNAASWSSSSRQFTHGHKHCRQLADFVGRKTEENIEQEGNRFV